MDYGKIRKIHKSVIDGQRKQMVAQIDKYGLYDFWEEYREYLYELYMQESAIIKYFSDAVISYHRIKNR